MEGGLKPAYHAPTCQYHRDEHNPCRCSSLSVEARSWSDKAILEPTRFNRWVVITQPTAAPNFSDEVAVQPINSRNNMTANTVMAWPVQTPSVRGVSAAFRARSCRGLLHVQPILVDSRGNDAAWNHSAESTITDKMSSVKEGEKSAARGIPFIVRKFVQGGETVMRQRLLRIVLIVGPCQAASRMYCPEGTRFPRWSFPRQIHAASPTASCA